MLDPSILDDFIDVSEALRSGIYVLLHRGTPIYIGKAKGPTLALIAAHRANARGHVPAWNPIPGINFDQVLVRYVHPDRIQSTFDHLLATLRPRYNANSSRPPVTAPDLCASA